MNHESMYQTWIHQCTSLPWRRDWGVPWMWRRRRMTWLAVFEEKEWLALQRSYYAANSYLIQNSTNYLHIRSVLLVTKSESYSQQWAGGSGHLLWDLTQWEACIASPSSTFPLWKLQRILISPRNISWSKRDRTHCENSAKVKQLKQE